MDKELTFKESIRFHRQFCYNGLGCNKCPMRKLQEKNPEITCYMLRYSHTDEYERIMEKWCNEHPAKTYFQDFKEKFPNTSLNGTSNCYSICRNRVYKNGEDCDMRFKSCVKCWNEEIK